MSSRIPSTKAAPADILDLMQIISENVGNLERMKKEIHKYLLKKSLRGKRNEYNSVYAICLPTLKRLDLVEGEGNNIRLSQDGEVLINTYKNKGDLEYKRLFAKIFLRIDFEKAHVVENILKYDSEYVSFNKLVEYLKENGVDTDEKDDRLKRWLRLLKFVNFIEEEGDKLRINKYQINGILYGKHKISYERFIDTFFEAYERLQQKGRGSKFVKIPDLEREVCKRLKTYYYTTYDFRQSITQLRGKQIDNKKIVFSKPGAREKGGIKIEGNYYFYISIFNIGENQ